MADRLLKYDVAMKSTKTVWQMETPRCYKGDENTVTFDFNITDLEAADLVGVIPNVYLYMRDGSFFQNGPADGVKITGTIVNYTMKGNEGKHSGIARAQLVLVWDDEINPPEKLTSQLYDFEVVSGLENKVAVEVMIQDWTTLTREARTFIDTSSDEVDALKGELQTAINTANASLGEFDVALETGIVAANLAEKLEDFESTNNSRLLSTERQLAETNELSAEAVAKADAMASGSPKGVYATLALLQAAYPTGTTGAYLVTADGKWYYWSGSAWTIGGVYQATGLADGSVSGIKLAQDLVKTDNRNILDESQSVTGGFYSYTTGLWSSDVSRRTSGFIPCEYGDNIAKNAYIGGHLTYWNESGVFISGAYKAGETYFIVPKNTDIKFFRVDIPNTSSKNQTAIVRGRVLPAKFVTFGQKILDVNDSNVSEGSLKADKLSGLLTRTDITNLLDESACIYGGYYQYTNGVWTDSEAWRSSGLIACSPKDVFTRKDSGGNHITFWNSSQDFVSGSQLSSDQITVPENETIVGFKINISNTYYNQTMVVKGVTLPSRYYAFGEKIIDVQNQNIAPKSITIDKLSDKFVAQYLGGDYLKPFNRVTNPVITKTIVTDRTGQVGVADPFIVIDKGRYHMFFEVLAGVDASTGLAADEIGHAYSDDLINWTYTQIVLSKAIVGHRSAYPHVFKVDGEWYMLPDTVTNIKLYKATNFPLQWEFQSDLIQNSGVGFTDTNIFKVGDVWYLTTSGGSAAYNGLSLYYNISGDWKNTSWVFHSVIIPNGAVEKGHRGAGNPIVRDDYVLIPVQVTPVSTNVYGEYTKLYKLGNLSTTTAVVTDLGKFTSAQYDGGWQDSSSHHASHAEYVNGNIYAVDGTKGGYSIGLFLDS